MSGGLGSARNCTAVEFGGFVAVLLFLPFPHGFPGLNRSPPAAPSDGQDTLTTVRLRSIPPGSASPGPGPCLRGLAWRAAHVRPCSSAGQGAMILQKGEIRVINQTTCEQLLPQQITPRTQHNHLAN